MHRSTEHALAAQRRRDARLLETPDAATDPENVTTITDDEHLLNLPNIQRRMISMTGRAFERTILWRLDWYNFMYLPSSLSFR